jgi:hypothetical protein
MIQGHEALWPCSGTALLIYYHSRLSHSATRSSHPEPKLHMKTVWWSPHQHSRPLFWPKSQTTSCETRQSKSQFWFIGQHQNTKNRPNQNPTVCGKKGTMWWGDAGRIHCFIADKSKPVSTGPVVLFIWLSHIHRLDMFQTWILQF